MKSQLFKENSLNQAATDAKRVQDVDFPVVPTQTRDERRAAGSAEVALPPSARISALPSFNPRKMAERSIP